jgi:hypothetical protein
VIFHSYVNVYQRVDGPRNQLTTGISPLSSCFINSGWPMARPRGCTPAQRRATKRSLVKTRPQSNTLDVTLLRLFYDTGSSHFPIIQVINYCCKLIIWEHPQNIPKWYRYWLVVSTPLKNMKVSWDDDIPNIWENEAMFQTTNQLLRLSFWSLLGFCDLIGVCLWRYWVLLWLDWAVLWLY